MSKAIVMTCSERWGGTCQHIVSSPYFECHANHLLPIANTLSLSKTIVPSSGGKETFMKIEDVIARWDLDKEASPYLEANEMLALPSSYRHLAAFSAFEAPVEMRHEINEDLAKVANASHVPMAIHPSNLQTLIASSITGTSSFYLDQVKILASLYKGREEGANQLEIVVKKALSKGIWSRRDCLEAKRTVEENFPASRVLSLLDQALFSPSSIARAV